MSLELRQGDWRDVIPGTYDPSRAVVVTDPPFGLAGSSGDRGYADELPWSEHVRAVLELLPAVRYVIRGPASELVRRDHPEPRRICIELAPYRRRGAHRPGTVPYLWIGWAVYGRLAIARHPRSPLGDAKAVRPYGDPHGGIGGGDHHGVTPYASAVWMVETWTDPGMVVLDPYAGIGTIGRAAGAFGFDYVGAELDPRWAAEARWRMLTTAPSLELEAGEA